MCGIAGFAGQLARTVDTGLLRHMTNVLSHRGPDASGYWRSETSTAAFGHRRLAIIDLSPGGAQPMQVNDGQWSIVYNGELYNYRTLRKELEACGVTFRSESDTEVLLRSCVHWGVVEALKRANGMFALALWSERDQQLWLARDRFGEKPLFYGSFDGSIAFASELTSLRLVPGFSRRVDRQTLAAYMKLNSCPSPTSIFVGINKLKPGTAVCFSFERDASVRGAGREHVFFDPVAESLSARRDALRVPVDEAVRRVDDALGESVRQRMVSDVPLGAFLSGGIDSSVVVAQMCRFSPTPVRTFTIGFDDATYDESTHAAAVARHLKTDHTAVTLSARDALSIIPQLPAIYDEPFGDSSQIPTYLVSQVARRHVTVALSGDGGDEIFGGYRRYSDAAQLWNRIHRWPRPTRVAAARAIKAVQPSTWDTLSSPVHGVLRSRISGRVGDLAHKVAGLIDARSNTELYDRLRSGGWPQSVVRQVEVLGVDPLPGGADLTFVEGMMLADTTGYLPDDILTKVDRASMAVSLEARVPMLDPDVFRLAWQLPQEHRVAGRTGKVVLRGVLQKYVPAELFDRPKMGFGVPIGEWLRSDLREWAEDLLAPARLRSDGYFDETIVRRVWTEHVSGRRNHQDMLWPVLMFQGWSSHQSTADASLVGA